MLVGNPPLLAGSAAVSHGMKWLRRWRWTAEGWPRIVDVKALDIVGHIVDIGWRRRRVVTANYHPVHRAIHQGNGCHLIFVKCPNDLPRKGSFIIERTCLK